MLLYIGTFWRGLFIVVILMIVMHELLVKKMGEYTMIFKKWR